MTKLCFGTSLAALMMASALGLAYAADYTPVTDARLAESGASKLANDARQLRGL